MNLITIPKKISGAKDDLVVLPRKEYEALLARPDIREFTPTKANLRDLARARRNFRAGKMIPYEDVRRELGLGRRSRRS